MLVIVSPAKKLDFDSRPPIDQYEQPKFLDKSRKLIQELRKCSASEISKMMKLSESLTKLNMERYQSFKTPFTPKNAKQAIYSFMGDTYVGFDASTLSEKSMQYAQDHMRILSGLYGVLAPLELIQPYRLEMGTKFSIAGNKNLYEYWKEDLTKEMNALLCDKKILVNCASNEYSGAIDFKSIEGRVITPIFKDSKNGEYKIISFYAKKARGMMARYIVENKINSVAKLKKFNTDGYYFDESSSTENELVFLRD
ncbi:peroxide stress protein YaaA [Halobacteriovorax marinus]|uniref:UPF0246 protein BMS_1839 n=1 Tax=Halobacteriovorax marinus (strain ATCC BAA-682 / DSM 15412 / SJ) TaxID=862908 RepID=E1X200_HALMS|nr:peroxide stress protein YaaA [Halobacteriovorax marinus]ATH08011.1 peroxide stress protein YaaA [Halobacteriovorax marinus]CBW26660.1 Hypothetical UPF0246 protein yaaA [Halobacteriovorax marinus SJ]